MVKLNIMWSNIQILVSTLSVDSSTGRFIRSNLPQVGILGRLFDRQIFQVDSSTKRHNGRHFDRYIYYVDSSTSRYINIIFKQTHWLVFKVYLSDANCNCANITWIGVDEWSCDFIRLIYLSHIFNLFILIYLIYLSQIFNLLFRPLRTKEEELHFVYGDVFQDTTDQSRGIELQEVVELIKLC